MEPPSVQDQTLGTTVVPLILLAEDNEANIETITSYLQARGYRFQIAHNGFQALDRLHEDEPDLILMDIQMPKMDGLEAIRQIRREAQYQHLPIIALTALAMPGDKERCLRAGATEYISKPVRLKELALQIQTLLNST